MSVRTLRLALILILLAGCASPRSFAELSVDAEAVPVPRGVTFVRQQEVINDGPGFTSSKFEQVTRQYSANLPCDVLENSWADVLRAAGRRFKITNYPHKFGVTGSLEIEIDDRPEILVITIGNDSGPCASPFVSSFNRPH